MSKQGRYEVAGSVESLQNMSSHHLSKQDTQKSEEADIVISDLPKV